MSKKSTAELEARQEEALAKIITRKELIEQLKNQNSFLEKRVTELESAGGITAEEAAALRAELEKSNALLETLQDAVLSDEAETEPAPPTE